MQLESLKVLCDLAETANFTKTARINSVTQSAVSQTISNLEHQFKTLLVERSKKNFRLTAEGQAVYEYSKRMLQSYDAIFSQMQELKGIISGDIRIATIYSLGLHCLPPYIRRFMTEHSEVRIRVEYRHADQIYQDVASNVVDLGLVACPERDAKVEVVPLRQESLVLVCPPEHPLARSKTVKLKALQGQNFVSFDPDIPTRKLLDGLFKDHGVKVHHVMEFDNVETVKKALEIGSGIAILPEKTVVEEVASKNLTTVKVEGNPSRLVGVIYRKGRVLSPAMKQFIALLKTNC